MEIQGKIIKGEFPERINLDNLEFSLAKTLYKAYKNKEVGIEFFVTDIPKTFDELFALDIIDLYEYPWIRHYSIFRTRITKDNLIRILSPLTNLFEYNLSMIIEEDTEDE